MNASQKVSALVEKVPGPDSRSVQAEEGKAQLERLLDEVLQLGRDGVVELAGLAQDGDAKARYALHALAVRVCRPAHRKQRGMFASALARALGGDRPKEAQAFVVRQLQVAGGKEAVGALGKLLADRDLCEPAAQALLAIKDGAAEPFRAALSRVEGAQRLTVVQALGVLRDRKSAEALRPLTADKDRDTRLAALWALANMGDVESVEAVTKAADGKEGHERIKATQACLLLAERLQAAGRSKEAQQLYRHLRDTRTDPSEKYVREAAERALGSSG